MSGSIFCLVSVWSAIALFYCTARNKKGCYLSPFLIFESPNAMVFLSMCVPRCETHGLLLCIDYVVVVDWIYILHVPFVWANKKYFWPGTKWKYFLSSSPLEPWWAYWVRFTVWNVCTGYERLLNVQPATLTRAGSDCWPIGRLNNLCNFVLAPNILFIKKQQHWNTVKW